MKIVYEDNSELANFEAENKGYRKDVIVELNNKYYKLYIITFQRLQQDFEMEYRDSHYYLQEPNTIIVNTMSKDEIEFVIEKMSKSDYFEKLDRKGF